jgi:hypothetical protein
VIVLNQCILRAIAHLYGVSIHSVDRTVGDAVILCTDINRPADASLFVVAAAAVYFHANQRNVISV